MKACIFIDGENLRHSIVDLFKPEFQEHDYLPETAKWALFFTWLVQQIRADAQLIRTYWYVIEMVDYFPYNLPNPDTVITRPDKLEKLRKIMSLNELCQKELDKIHEPEKNTYMIERLKILCKNKNEFEKRFDGWTEIQDSITLRHRGIEFRRAGAIKYNLFEKDLGKEKAVDVKLATDLITLKDIYDIAVIVSGDQDYVPAVKIVKDAGKQVVNVVFKTRKGDILPSGARRLNLITDWNYQVSFQDFENYLQIKKSP